MSALEQAIRAIVVEEIQKYLGAGNTPVAQPAIPQAQTPAPVTSGPPLQAGPPVTVPPGPPVTAPPPAPGAPPVTAATPPMAPGAPVPPPAPVAPQTPGVTLDQIRDKLNNWWRAHPDRSGEIMVILGEMQVQKVDDLQPAQYGAVWQKLEALGA